MSVDVEVSTVVTWQRRLSEDLQISDSSGRKRPDGKKAWSCWRCSACVLSLDICEHNVPECSTYASQFPKQISHSGRVIQKGVTVQGRNTAESFELDLYSFADFLERVPQFPCGHHIAGLALRLGVVRTGLSKSSVFPKAGLGQFSWPSNKAYSEQGRNGPIRYIPLRDGPSDCSPWWQVNNETSFVHSAVFF